MSTAAFDTVYRRHFPAVRARCRRMLRSDAAEDVAQETFLRLWRSGLPLDRTEPPALAAWLRQTSTRLSLDAIARRCSPSGDVDGLPARSTSSEDLVDARARLARVAACAPREDLAAALLVRADGLTHAEAAGELDVSERTLRRRLARFDGRLVGRAVAALVLVLAVLASARSCSAATNDVGANTTERAP